MSAAEDERSTPGRRGRILLSLSVTIGIALFIVGFVMTVVSLSEDSAASAVNSEHIDAVDERSDTTRAGTMFIGLILSMAGLVVATTVPAAHFIRVTKDRP